MAGEGLAGRPINDYGSSRWLDHSPPQWLGNEAGPASKLQILIGVYIYESPQYSPGVEGAAPVWKAGVDGPDGLLKTHAAAGPRP